MDNLISVLLEEDWANKLEALALDKSSNAQNDFSFLTLKVFLHGNETEREKIQDMFSKSGVLFKRRMILSRVRFVYEYLMENLIVPVKTKKEEKVYSYQSIFSYAGKVPLFNVSTAYNTIKRDN